ncbi:hypothetical protein PENTCL1PPCAC_785, partial [Pristionchus entomophagus]
TNFSCMSLFVLPVDLQISASSILSASFSLEYSLFAEKAFSALFFALSNRDETSANFSSCSFFISAISF